MGNGELYLSVSSTEESTLFLMHPVSAFPDPFPHTHIVCRAITDLAGDLIQEYNLFQTKCTLFPPGQLNWNKSVQKHWPEAKHFLSWKDVWWLPLWAPPQPYLELWDGQLIPSVHCLSAKANHSRVGATCDGVLCAIHTRTICPNPLKEWLQEWSPHWNKCHRCSMKLLLS